MGPAVKLSVDELCQPEILSLDTIRNLLIARGMSKENILNADRSELISLWNKLILPLPQRVNKRTKSQCQNGKDTTTSPNRKTSTSNRAEIKFSSDDKHHHNNIDNNNQRLNLRKRLNPDTAQSDCPQAKRQKEPIKWP